MIVRTLLVGILAGALAGLLLTAIQRIQVIPLIFEAETYEAAAAVLEHDDEAQADHGHGEGAAQAWAPKDGVERTAYTALANVLIAIGFGLLLTAAYTIAGRVDWRRGLLWGLAGFFVFNLAPAISLPPELPGAASADLVVRRAWWLLTVALTAGGLAVIAFAPRGYFKPLGLALIALPHLGLAPDAGVHGSSAPPDLETAFVFASLGVNAVFWVMLGGLCGFLFSRLAIGAEPELSEQPR